MIGLIGRQLRRIWQLSRIFPVVIRSSGLPTAIRNLIHVVIFRGLDGVKAEYAPYLRAKTLRDIAILQVRNAWPSATLTEVLDSEVEHSDESFDVLRRLSLQVTPAHYAYILSILANHKGAFTGMKRRGYVISAPNFVSNSAGIACLYRLCNDLNERGYPSYVTTSLTTNSQIIAPLVPLKEARRLVSRGFVAVYPEIIAGNPLNATTVARWVLNRPGLLGGDRVFDSSELVFCYSDVYRSSIANSIAGKL